MKRHIIVIMALLVSMFAFAACSSDTHFDSISSEITLNVASLANDGKPFKVRQRFQFDRDLTTLTAMRLEEAWLSAPSSGIWNKDDPKYYDNQFSLDIVRSIDVYLIKSETEPSIYWMLVPPSELVGQDAVFSAFNVGDSKNYGDLRDYLNENHQLEIEIELALEPYHVSRYWRDVCGMSKDCVLKLPFSMQFKMED